MNVLPTFRGLIDDEFDAALLIQAVLDGKLQHVLRRPSDFERQSLIVPGNVFVFIEEMSGIKRWTDGINWSPSRISGKFLIYKELNRDYPSLISSSGPIPPRVNMPNFQSPKNNVNTDMNIHLNNNRVPYAMYSQESMANYPSIHTGFVKKTFSIKLPTGTNNQVYHNIHIISYYNESDNEDGKLETPKKHFLFKSVTPSPILIKTIEQITLGNSRTNPSKPIDKPRKVTKDTVHRTKSDTALAQRIMDPIENRRPKKYRLPVPYCVSQPVCEHPTVSSPQLDISNPVLYSVTDPPISFSVSSVNPHVEGGSNSSSKNNSNDNITTAAIRYQSSSSQRLPPLNRDTTQFVTPTFARRTGNISSLIHHDSTPESPRIIKSTLMNHIEPATIMNIIDNKNGIITSNILPPLNISDPQTGTPKPNNNINNHHHHSSPRINQISPTTSGGSDVGNNRYILENPNLKSAQLPTKIMNVLDTNVMYS
ncbi:Gti1/Pac2 family protein NDAI_0B01050 [Naumovozyma dairenensis CBS 421]|uniref:Uncharacterized protein n=1 Tax=Naumovozyma dairenensis (strain ATCC 10597 / BCRC 20456 / CBS 421 / NBRC 0211 / NRRL Y-12639) TaxID=1071378 RepID=G0W5S8_NAUDC|nr:hypothetical protein NDAI_0B01050 [Naumovozyma dairenensis CBS 421]CCD23139.1 hypothetical protein NDAI_0B01050 [Naumovozyma dairenensis CBS 421]